MVCIFFPFTERVTDEVKIFSKTNECFFQEEGIDILLIRAVSFDVRPHAA